MFKKTAQYLSIYNLASQFIYDSLKKTEQGYLEIITSENKKFDFGINGSIPRANLKINNPKFAFNLIKGGSPALAEAYINGDFETEDLKSLIEFTAKNISIVHKFSGILQLPIINTISNEFLKLNTKTRSKKNISFHYDLGNDFFSEWLDKTLTYSCGIFNTPNDSLESAQINKYNKLINLLKIKSGSKILEIGCGWGGFAEHIGKNFDVKLDCVTISKKQYEYCQKRIYSLGLNHKIKFKLQDYRDIKEKYDAIASIEMIEAVGEKYIDKYFEVIKNNLSYGGNTGIQVITINDNLYNRYRKNEDFIQRYIFPGGFLPSINSLKNTIKKKGLKITKHNSYGHHYCDTLKTWRKNFTSSWNKISQLGFDEKFKKLWNFYFTYCEAGFKSKNIDLVQLSLCNR